MFRNWTVSLVLVDALAMAALHLLRKSRYRPGTIAHRRVVKRTDYGSSLSSSMPFAASSPSDGDLIGDAPVVRPEGVASPGAFYRIHRRASRR